MSFIIAIIAVAAIAAAVYFFVIKRNKSSDQASILPPPPPPAVWSWQFSPGMPPVTPTPQGFMFEFPASDGAHYLVMNPARPLNDHIRFDCMIYVTDNPTFVSAGEPQGAAGPCKVTVYLQRAGDDWNGTVGTTEFYRWFCVGKSVILQPGQFSVDIPLASNDGWISVWGRNDPNMFQAALAAPMAVGIVFGDPAGGATGHGVYVTGGTAGMSVNNFEAV